MDRDPKFMEHVVPTSLHRLAQSNVSGTMTVRCGERSADFVIHDGLILGASSTEVPKLGHFLPEVARRDFFLALAIQARKKVRHPIGTILVDLGLAAGEVVERAIGRQISAVMKEVTSWGNGVVFFSYSELAFDRFVRPPVGLSDAYLMGVAIGRAREELDEILGA